MHSATNSQNSAPRPAAAGERGNVDAVTRALKVLDAFLPYEQGLRLADMSRRLGMEKSTVLRTARTLARSGYLVQLEDGRWRLGPAAGDIGLRYQTSFDIGHDIDAVLRKLATESGETAAFFVREGEARICVARIDWPSVERFHIRTGEKLPLDRGASGHVLMAFAGTAGDFYSAVRRVGHYISLGERDSRMSSIAVPVFGARRKLFGALCISGLAHKLGEQQLTGYLPALQRAAQSLSAALARQTWSVATGAAGAWHPK